MPFEVVPQDGYLLIKLSGELIDETSKAFQIKFKEERDKIDAKLAIFESSELSVISDSWLRALAMTHKALKALNGDMRLVGSNEKIKAAIQKMGLDRILITKMSLRGALVDLGLVKAKEFDVNFINPFLAATQKVFKVQCFLEAKPGKPALKKPTDPLLLGDISGIISITSESFTGTLAISLTEEIFKKIAENMLGEPCPEVNENNIDLVGELANIILGQAKLDLNKVGYSIQMALPSCVWGKDHKIKHFGGGICIVIPFETETGIFYTEVMTNNNLLQAAKGAKSEAA